MKFTQTSPGQIEYKQSGMGSIVLGSIFLVVSIGLAVSPFIFGAPIWAVGLGLLFAAFSAYIILQAEKTHTILRNPGSSEITATKLITHKQTKQGFDASDVVSVALDTKTDYVRDTDSNGRSRTRRERVSVLYVQLKDNNQVVIMTDSGGSGGFSVNGINLSGYGKAPLSDEAVQLASFYNVPLNAHEEKPMGIEDIGRVVGQIKQGLSGTSGESQPMAVPPVVQTPSVPESSPSLSSQAPPPTPPSAPLQH